MGGRDRREIALTFRRIVPRLRRAGYRFVTVPRLLRDAPPVAAEQGLAPGVEPPPSR